jgi:hypothetical protein
MTKTKTATITNQPARVPICISHFRPLRLAIVFWLLPIGLAAAGCDVILHIGSVANRDRGIGGGRLDGGSSDGMAETISGTGGSFVPVAHPLPNRHPAFTSASKLDLLFMIDDSSSMAPLQEKLRTHLPDFMNVLKSLPGGLPDLHVAVVSSSLGAGKFGDVPGCGPQSAGNLSGSFQHSAACTQLMPGNSFLVSAKDGLGGRVENFTGGDLTAVLSCIANLGQSGCGFEHQFESTRLALQRSLIAGDENAGFLRSDAYLGIVMLTDEDDCSVPADSDLFDPSMQTLADPYGGLQSYRCNEFGHKCDQRLPHTVAGLPMTLTGCASKEDGRLIRVSEFVDFLFNLKTSPEKIFVAAIAGPATPYTVSSYSFMLGNGATEAQPRIEHSCTSGAAGTEYADPGVRIQQLTQAFGPNSFFASICDADLKNTMVSLAQRMVGP